MSFSGFKDWFQFDIPEETKQGFDTYIYRLNIYRAKTISYMLILSQILLLIFYFTDNSEKLLSLSVKTYFTMSILMLIITIGFIIFILPLAKDVRKNLEEIKFLGFLFAFLVLSWCMVLTLLYQRSSGEVAVYITGIFAVSILAVFHPFKMLMMLLPIHLIFLILLPYFQNSPSRVFENMVITTVDVIVSLIISREFYKNKINSFKTKKSIQEQNVLLTKTNLELEKANHKLELLSYTDGLTGLLNRRKFDEVIRLEWDRCKRYSIPISIIMIDIDFYKKYNDFYGHQAGDECIAKITKAIFNLVRRSSDIIARYGGEEFIIALPHIKAERAFEISERIRTTVESLNIPHENSTVSNRVTISLGVSTMIPWDGLSVGALIQNADIALYKAKEKRNCSILLD